MKNVLIDENGDYGIECSNAIWASNQMHQEYGKYPFIQMDEELKKNMAHLHKDLEG